VLVQHYNITTDNTRFVVYTVKNDRYSTEIYDSYNNVLTIAGRYNSSMTLLDDRVMLKLRQNDMGVKNNRLDADEIDDEDYESTLERKLFWFYMTEWKLVELNFKNLDQSKSHNFFVSQSEDH
jgi:hypothetical protein